MNSDVIIVVEEIDISRPPFISRDEFVVIWRALVFVVGSQDALETHAHTFNGLYW
jgi:hypothetical protein